MANAIEVIEEKVFTDGSGAVGTYKVYGKTYSGIHTGVGGHASARPWHAPRNGYFSRKERGMVSTACRKIERHMVALFEGSK